MQNLINKLYGYFYFENFSKENRNDNIENIL